MGFLRCVMQVMWRPDTRPPSSRTPYGRRTALRAQLVQLHLALKDDFRGRGDFQVHRLTLHQLHRLLAQEPAIRSPPPWAEPARSRDVIAGSVQSRRPLPWRRWDDLRRQARPPLGYDVYSNGLLRRRRMLRSTILPEHPRRSKSTVTLLS